MKYGFSLQIQHPVGAPEFYRGRAVPSEVNPASSCLDTYVTPFSTGKEVIPVPPVPEVT